MDCLLNDEIFDHDNDELLQTSRLDSMAWYDESIRDLQCDNQFFNDQDIDIMSFEEEKNIIDKIPTSTSIFQVSPDRFSRGVSPEVQFNENQQRLPWRSVALMNRHKLTLSSHNMTSVSNGCDNDPLIENDDYGIVYHNSEISEPKFKTPGSISLFQVTPTMLDWRDREDVERKYPTSPSTMSPDSLADFDTTPRIERAVSPSRVFSNNLQYKPCQLKYRPYKDDCHSIRQIYNTRLFQSPIPQSGVLALTEEEKRTLLTEGYQIPYRLPLTKHEERNLKKVRRKIKNKISAQESRKKKKEYMEALEKKVEIYAHENDDLRQNLEHQESINKSLLMQLRHLQHMVGRASSNTTSTCVMVFLICFSLILVGLPEINQPMNSPPSVPVVGNIHKFGYGSVLQCQRPQMTAMRRYLPPDIDGFVNMSYEITENVAAPGRPKLLLCENKGNEPLHSLESPVSGQRKSVLLGNVREDEDECVQYGPRYLWWLLQSPNFDTGEAATSPVTSTNLPHFTAAITLSTMNASLSRHQWVGLHNMCFRSREVAVTTL